MNPNGHVHSFDFHETRVSVAKNEFAAHGLGNIVTVGQRDVCANGYGEDMNSVADAVFLDLPLPWEAILHAVKCFKNEGIVIYLIHRRCFISDQLVYEKRTL